jgi:hypothetical protein
VCPGVYDGNRPVECLTLGISARVALEAGAKCLYMTGAGTTASRLGQPDLGIATLNDFVDNGAMIVSIAGDVPVICGTIPLFHVNCRCGHRVWRVN